MESIMLTLSVGITIDAFVWDKWRVVDIIDIDDDNLTVMIYGYGLNQTPMVIQNNDKNVASLHMFTTQIIRLKEPPKLQWIPSKPQYYHSSNEKKNYLIICPPSSDKYVYKYDISENKYITFAQYPLHFEFTHCRTALDQKNNLLYIVASDDNCFGSLNLENGDWNILIDNKCNKMNENSLQKLNVNTSDYSVLSIDSNKNELYLFDNDMIPFTFNSNDNILLKCKMNKHCIDDEIDGDLRYIAYNNSFMIWSNNKIFYCDINKLEWKLYDDGNTILPQTQNENTEFYTILAFDTLIFIIYLFEYRDIWILNLMDNKWFKSDKTYLNIDCESVSMINSFDNNIHIIDTWMRYHFKLCLLDLIPIQMYQYYKTNQYNKLIDGYLKEKQATKFPDSLKSLILSFYPIWCY